MALKLPKKDNRNLARLVTGEKSPCVFCLREVDDEVQYGKLYAIGDIQCHYFCCLLSCCLIQKGNDDMGLFGFMYTDIVTEVERCKKHKCSYCGLPGANLGCSVGVCRKQFHLPCGREKNAVSLYYGTYKSFCQQHAPRQKIPEQIMANAKQRKRIAHLQAFNKNVLRKETNLDETTEEMVCVICYEQVDAYPTVNTFWPVCCGKDEWFHRTCLQRMALSAGMHYLKCPLCNDKESFYNALVEQGYYVPDRDAAWELEQNAFAEIYERPATCSAESCLCPSGRSHDAETGEWDIKLCLLCGSAGAHAQCIDQSQPSKQIITNQLEAPENMTNQSDQDKQSIDVSKENEDCFRESFTPSLSISTTESNSVPNNLCITPNKSDRTPNKLDSTPNKSDKTPNKLEGTSNKLNRTPNKLEGTSNKLNRTPNKLDGTPNKLYSTPNKLDETSNKLDGTPNKLDSTPNELVETPNKFNASPNKYSSIRFVCQSCLPAAPEDLSALASSIEAIIQQEQAASEVSRPVMTSRMSIRRTKGGRAVVDRTRPSTSRHNRIESNNALLDSNNVVSSRLDLNLKTPRRMCREVNIKENFENKLLSPVKLLEQSFKHKMARAGVSDAVLNKDLIDALTGELRKPRPMCERRRLVENLIDGYFDNLKMETKQKEPPKEWNSPKKHNHLENCQVLHDDSPRITEDQDKENDFCNVPNKNHSINVLTKDQINNITIHKYKDFINNKIASIDNCDVDLNKTNFEENVIKGSDLSSNKNIDFQSDVTILAEKEGSDNNTKSNGNVEEKCQNNDTDIENTSFIQNSRKTRNSESNNTNSKNDLTETSEIKFDELMTTDETSAEEAQTVKISFTRDKRKSQNGVEKKNKESKSNRKFRSRSESSEMSMFKNILTEKELCSRLLLELTTGKIDDDKLNTKVADTIKTDYTNENNTKKQTTEVISTETNVSEKTLSSANENTKLKDIHKSSPLKTQKSNNSDTPKSSKKHLKRSKKSLSLTKTKNVDTNDHNDNSKNASKQKSKTSEEYAKKTDNKYRNLKTHETRTFLENENANDMNGVRDTPKHKTIDIQQDSSLEISGNDQHINIDVIKIEDSPTTGDSYKKLKLNLPNDLKTCLKFSPIEDTLEKNDVGIDLESFKKEYLSEVDREFKCNFKHNHNDNNSDSICERRYRSPIDFAIGAAMKEDEKRGYRKRKLSESGLKLVFNNSDKRRKMSESDLQLSYDYDKNIPEISRPDENVSNKKRDKTEKLKKRKDRRKPKKSKKSRRDENIEVTIDSTETRRQTDKTNKNFKTKFAIRSNNIRVKIQCKIERVSSKIESKRRKVVKNADSSSKFKQYILQFPEGSSKEILVKPEKEVGPLKKKYVKYEKSPDKFKQMSIESFFKVKSDK